MRSNNKEVTITLYKIIYPKIIRFDMETISDILKIERPTRFWATKYGMGK